MDCIKLLTRVSALAAAIALMSCATPPPPAPAPAPAPIVYMPPGDPPPPDEWNIFPDPTTGQVDIYHKGDYVGAVTGKEPETEDPPMPHPVQRPQQE
jgi:hypothetical protein